MIKQVAGNDYRDEVGGVLDAQAGLALNPQPRLERLRAGDGINEVSMRRI